MTVYPDIIAIGIPIMIACVVIEFIFVLRNKINNFRINASLSNISCGIFEQVTGFISKGLFLGVYLLVYNNWRLFSLEDTFWVWVALIVLVDFTFYWFHRLSHTSSFLWAGHVIHHEIEEFNLTVALRRSVMQEFTIIWIYLPFALFGFSPGAFFLVFAGHNLYQFLIHTPYLPEMRIFGLLFNTPYHHELHHARNECYIDTNFAGVFITWDKLFGTFVTRTEKPEFGVGHLTTTLNPITAQITTLMAVIKETQKRQGLWQKLRAFFGPPDYLAWDYGNPTRASTEKRPVFDPKISAQKLRLAIISFIVLVVVVTLYRNYETQLSALVKSVAMLITASALFYIGNILDGKFGKDPVNSDSTPDQHNSRG